MSDMTVRRCLESILERFTGLSGPLARDSYLDARQALLILEGSAVIDSCDLETNSGRVVEVPVRLRLVPDPDGATDE